MINSKNEFKLVDFGISNFDDHTRSTITGAPLYMAPEILAQKQYGTEADVWSLGVLLYEIHAGIDYNLKPF